MSKIITPKNHEVILEDEDIIVSKTDLKGRITYANRIFMRISGYNEEESLGHPHNIIRHPDMPRGVYYFMWKTLQAEHEFFGFVKNLCIDGSYYWAFANVTCDYNLDDRVVGYYSVRRKTPDAAKQAVTPLYKEMINIENRCSAAAAPETSANYLLEQMDKQNTTYEKYILSFV